MIKLATLFSGIGAPEKAFRMLGIDYDLAYFGEIDTHAVKSYCAIHNESESKNIGDITKVDIEKLPKNIDLLVGGSPCQDFSLAGKRKGGEVDSKTRSSLMWNFVEIIRETQPKCVLWENVKGALSDKDYPNYKKFCNELSANGYKLSAFTINGKLFGVPQNRERVFVLGSKTHTIRTPQGFDCGIRLKDVLESNVNEKYYLSSEQIKNIAFNGDKLTPKPNTIAPALSSREFQGTGWQNISQTLCARDYKDPKVVCELIELTQGQPQGAKTGLYAEPIINCINEYDENGKQRPQQDRVYNAENIMTTLSAELGGRFNIAEPIGTVNYKGKSIGVINIKGLWYAIRKLTPKECFRLMGFDDTDYQKCVDAGISNTQFYKQAGNSIIVQVLMAIFGEYYGIDWKPLVYGNRYKTGQSQFADLPIMN